MSEGSESHSTNDIRVFHTSQLPKMPFSIGRKGASWFLCFSHPMGVKGKRIYACINVAHSSLPFPSELPEGHSKFAFDTRAPNDGILQQLLKVEGQPLLRKTGIEFDSGIEKFPEVELLIMPSQTLRCCARCNK
jgi:hypothetical protein